uniref:Uncharacterized protein AlNc14C6G835 n=1 Tax=Albugo laibachii Nc14 TaxID=890382 RepID=F0W159_9STRA|nr:conserved hypothetical protein [Albugo laibachii Nc14]|eukprot:CCA14784.1 conserved hypothetical protein [Albugo laibachii Nc14]
MSKAASSDKRSSWTRRRRERARQDELDITPYSRRKPVRDYVSKREINESDEESSLELETESAKGKGGFFSTVLSYVPFIRTLLGEEGVSEMEEEEEEDARSSIKSDVTESPESVSDQELIHPTTQNQEFHDQVEKNPICLNTFRQPEETPSENVTPTTSNASQKAFVFDRSRKRFHEPNVNEARKVIKQQKTITWEEYERMSRDLRALVQDEKAESSTKPLPKPSMSEPISAGPHRQPVLTAYGSRNRSERLRSSRLLTHGSRDTVSRNAYSTAIAERVMNCLQKFESPMDEQRKKPTSGSSLSWANYQLTKTQKKIECEALQEPKSGQLEGIPPTKTLSLTFSMPKTTSAPAVKAPSPVLSKPEIPTDRIKTPEKKIEPVEKRSVFAVPPPPTESTQTQVDKSVKFLFSPPPTERRPPRRAPAQEKMRVSKGPRPLSFIASPPKVQSAKLSLAPPTNVIPKQVEQASESTQLKENPTNSAEASNPLAKFLKMAPGQWKCPTCAVSNADTVVKCPCCDTENPSKATSIPSKKAEADVTPPSSAFTFGVPSKKIAPSDPTRKQSSPDRIDSLETSEALSPANARNAVPFATSSIPASKASTFSFGIQPPPTTTFSAPTTSSFSFETKQEPPKPLFSFGVEASPVPQTADTSKTNFQAPIQPQSTPNQEISADANAPISIRFGAAPPQDTTLSTNKCKRPLETSDEPTPSKKTVNALPLDEKKACFTFGSPKPNSGDTTLQSISSETTPSASKPAFTFGSSFPAVTSFSSDSAGSSKATFGSGIPATSFSGGNPSGSVAFGSSNNNATPTFGNSNSTATPTFGNSNSKAAPTFGTIFNSQPAEAFVFSAPGAIETPAKETTLAKTPSFTFGSSENAATAPTTSFGSPATNAFAPRTFGNTAKEETSLPFGKPVEYAFSSAAFGQLSNVNNAFGSSAPTGNAAFGFGSSGSNTVPAFGNTSGQFAPGNSAPAFGNASFGGNGSSFSAFGASNPGNPAPFSGFGSSCMDKPASGPAFGTPSVGMNAPNAFSIGSAPTQPPQRGGRRILRARTRGKR